MNGTIDRMRLSRENESIHLTIPLQIFVKNDKYGEEVFCHVSCMRNIAQCLF